MKKCKLVLEIRLGDKKQLEPNLLFVLITRVNHEFIFLWSRWCRATLNILSWRQCNHRLTSFFGYVYSYVYISPKHFVWFVSLIYGFKQAHCFRIVHVTYATVTVNILLAKMNLLHMVVGGNVWLKDWSS